MYSTSSTAHCPHAVRQCVARVALPSPKVVWQVHYMASTAHYPRAVWRCIAAAPIPTAPGQRTSALRELHCPLPQSSEAVHHRTSTTYYPRAVWQCIAAVPLPTAPRQGGGAQQELHCPPPPVSEEEEEEEERLPPSHGRWAFASSPGGPTHTSQGRTPSYLRKSKTDLAAHLRTLFPAGSGSQRCRTATLRSNLPPGPCHRPSESPASSGVSVPESSMA